MNKQLWNIFVIILVVSTASATCMFPSNADGFDVYEEYKVTVFSSGADGYDTYRIPTIVQGADGCIYAFAEGRTDSAADTGNIDLVMKTSTDGGRTWSALSVIRDAGLDTAGNPAPVVDATTGRINLIYSVNNTNMYSTYSDDGGATWATDTLIDKSVLGADGARILTGPVHGIQLTRGENAGRLIVTTAYRSEKSTTGSYGDCVVYSDDGGLTWQIGATDTHAASENTHPSENVAVELTNGQLYFNARNHFFDSELGDNVTRAIAYSSDGGESYDNPFETYDAIDTPVVQNSVIRFAATDMGDSEDVLIYSAPCSTNNVREDMTLYLSFDEAETWSEGILIHDGMAAYSDLVKVDGSHVGLLFESGDYLGDYGRIDFSLVAVELPEPSTFALLIVGSVSLAMFAWRKRK